MAGETIQRYFLLLLLVGASILTFYIFQPFLSALILAGIFAVVLQPVYRALVRHMAGWKSTAAFLTVCISIICIIVPLSFIGTQVLGEGQKLYASLAAGSGKTYLDAALLKAEEKVGAYVPAASHLRDKFTANLDGYARQSTSWFVAHIGTAFSGLASILLSFFIFIIALYYFLRDGKVAMDMVMRLSPLENREEEEVFAKLEAAINSVVRGNLLIALIQSTLMAIGLTLFGVPNSILWGTVTFFAALIPGIGTSLVLIPCILYLFLMGDMGPALGLVVWGVVIVGTIDNLLAPRLVGRGMKLHPLLVLLSVFGGLSFFGAIGIFLGPLAISLLFALLSIYSKKNTRV